MHKKSIIKKTIQIGSSTLMSRFLGIIRELLMVRYLGANILSDAFVVAYQIPNLMRKIFAEGAMSAAFLPPFIATLRQDKQAAFRLMSLAFVLFEGSLLILCALGMIFTAPIVAIFAPGWPSEKIEIAVSLARILMPFIFFISSSALLGGALQAVGKFFVPAFGPILLNIVFIFGITICLFMKWPVSYLCFIILFGGFLQFMQHLIAYFRNGFYFGIINEETWGSFNTILVKFAFCAISMSALELSLVIDIQFASNLKDGTVTLIYYANRFLGIPLGVFAVAFSTILLPHFARISTYAPKRLNFYLYESAKLVFWVTIPCMLGMIFFSNKIFTTLFLSEKFSLQQAYEAGHILTAFVIGLFFFSFNKIILNVFYAKNSTFIPMIVSLIGTAVNISFNYLFISALKGVGLALATTISGVLQTFLLLYFLRREFGYHAYLGQFCFFCLRYIFQMLIIGSAFLIFYLGLSAAIPMVFSQPATNFLLEKIGFWLWVGPLSLVAGLLLYYCRSLFGVRLYFLD
jgi:putative peptidoglycan lipid II flippase